MTVPIERTNAVIHTHEFLRDLINPKITPRVPKSVRLHAMSLLRHYPSPSEMHIAAQKEDADGSEGYIKIFGMGYM